MGDSLLNERNISARQFERFIRERARYDAEHFDRDRTLLLISVGAGGEMGEAMDHFKKVVRDYDADFDLYPADKRQEALLEFGDALNYFTRCAHEFGFTLEQIMAANVVKLERRDAGLEPGRPGRK